MLWCQDAKNIGLSNHLMTYIRAKVHRMITMHARPRQADRQTDRRTSVMAIGGTIRYNERIAR